MRRLAVLFLHVLFAVAFAARLSAAPRFVLVENSRSKAVVALSLAATTAEEEAAER